MSRHPLPDGAWPIAKARQQGLRPDGAIIVSFVGPTPWEGVHVFCEGGQQYDWNWSENLWLTIVTEPGIDVTDAINGCFWPENTKEMLTLIDIERQQVFDIPRVLPRPVLWPRDSSAHFPAEEFAKCA